MIQANISTCPNMCIIVRSRTMISRCINALIFIITLYLVLRDTRSDGHFDSQKVRFAFRFFTELSNVFCAFTALFMCLLPGANWVWVLKYIGTAAVTVTLLTVFLFLGPSTGNLKALLTGNIVSFSVFEKRGMSFSIALLGMLPVILYGFLYLYKVVFSPEDKRWDDFYGYNKGGKWPIAFALMMIGAFVVCMLLMGLQNLCL